MPSVVAIVTDDHGRVLLIHKTDNNLWALPGGGHEIGESIADTVVREVKEETGYDVAVDRVTGLYTNPAHVMAYDDGEVRQQFSIAFRARLLGGTPRTSSESRAVRVGRAGATSGAGPAPVHASADRARARGPGDSLHRLDRVAQQLSPLTHAGTGPERLTARNTGSDGS